MLVILVLALVGGATYALVPRTVLKDFFQTGDIPKEEEFKDVIDSSLNMVDDADRAESKTAAPKKEYVAGDTVVKSDAIYQAKVLSQTQTEFKLDTAQPVTFRWTPLVPKPQEPVTYRLKVWQLMQGQNSSQAMKTNKPIVTKDVADITETTVSGIYTGPCRPPYLCDYVWGVEILAAATTKSETTQPEATGAIAPGATEVSPSTEGTNSSDGTR